MFAASLAPLCPDPLTPFFPPSSRPLALLQAWSERAIIKFFSQQRERQREREAGEHRHRKTRKVKRKLKRRVKERHSGLRMEDARRERERETIKVSSFAPFADAALLLLQQIPPSKRYAPHNSPSHSHSHRGSPITRIDVCIRSIRFTRTKAQPASAGRRVSRRDTAQDTNFPVADLSPRFDSGKGRRECVARSPDLSPS